MAQEGRAVAGDHTLKHMRLLCYVQSRHRVRSTGRVHTNAACSLFLS